MDGDIENVVKSCVVDVQIMSDITSVMTIEKL